MTRRRESIAQNWHSIDDIADFVKSTQRHIEIDLVVDEPIPKKSSAEREDLIKTYLKKAEYREDVLNEKLLKQIIGGEYDILKPPPSKFAVNDPLIPHEKKWLDSEPDSDLFNDIRQRVINSKNRVDEINRATAVANQFFQHEQDKAELYEKNLPGLNVERERGIVRVTHDIVEEVLNGLIPVLCSELLTKSKSSLDILNRSFIKAMTNFSDQNKRFLKMSGRIDVLKGALLDIEDQYRFSHFSESVLDASNEEANYLNSLKSMYTVGLSQSLLIPSSSSGPSANSSSSAGSSSGTSGNGNLKVDKWKPEVQSVIQLTPDSYVHDTISIQPLVQSEQAHIGQLSLQVINGAPILLPSNIPGKIVFTKCCRQHKNHKNSLVYVGTSKGRVLVYLAPWNAAAAKLIAISPKSKESKERVDVIDIRISPVGPQMVIVMNREGYVYIYHMNQAVEVQGNLSQSGLKNNRKNKGFFATLFGSRNPNNTNNMDLLELNLIFKLNKYDVTLAVPLTKTLPTPYDKGLTSVAVDVNPDPPSSGGIISAVSNAVLNSNAIVLDKQMLPVVVSFHSCLSVLGRSTSFMIGTAGGDIVKYNMDYHLPSMNCKLVYPQNTVKNGVLHGSKSLPLPFVEKEYIHYHDAPSGFVLTNGNKENKGNHVYRELFHYHKAPIMVLDILDGLSDCLISIDEEGYMAVWRYSSDYLQEKHWFQPMTKSKLDFNHKQYVTSGEPVRFKNHGPEVPPEQWVPIVPSADEKVQLRRRHRGYDGKNHNVVIEVYYPIFSSDLNAFVQYVCYTVTDMVEVVLSYEVDESEPPPPRTEAHTVMSTTTSHDHHDVKHDDVSVVPEGGKPSSATSLAASVASATSAHAPSHSAHPKLNPQLHQAVTHAHQHMHQPQHQTSHHPKGLKPKKTAMMPKVSVYWSYQTVREKTDQLKLVSSRQVQDGTDIILLLSSEPREIKPTTVSKKSKKNVFTSITYYFVPIHSVTLQFHSMYPHLVIDSSVDQLLDYCVGPVMAETLTRLLFVLTKKDGVRIFSLESGHELISQVSGVDGFPFQCSLKSFQPSRISVCSSQRLLTLSSSDDARMLIYVIKHAKDGVALSGADSKLKDKEVIVAPVNKTDAKRTEEYLRSLSVETILNIQVLPPAPLRESQIDVHEIVEELLDGVFERAELLAVRKHQAALVESLYGPPPYGLIQPTVWPAPLEEPVFEVEEPPPPPPEVKEEKEEVQPEKDKAEESVNAAVAAVVGKKPSTESTHTEPEVKVEEQKEMEPSPAAEKPQTPPKEDKKEVVKEEEKELNNSDSMILGICVMAMEDVITSIILDNLASQKVTSGIENLVKPVAEKVPEVLISAEAKSEPPATTGQEKAEKEEVKSEPKSPSASSKAAIPSKDTKVGSPVDKKNEEEKATDPQPEEKAPESEPEKQVQPTKSPERPDSGKAGSEPAEPHEKQPDKSPPDSEGPRKVSSEDEWDLYNARIQFEQSVHY